MKHSDALRFDEGQQGLYSRAMSCVGRTEQEADLFIPGESSRVRAFRVLEILECGYNQRESARPHFILDSEALPHRVPKVSTHRKVNVKHHDKLRSGKESRDVAPSVELPVKRVDDEVDVYVGSHVGRRGVQGVQRGEDGMHVFCGVRHVDSDRDGTYSQSDERAAQYRCGRRPW
jgi:hypothetical protein